jgi:hypothetical protein
MTSIREQIKQAFLARIAGTDGVGTRIFRERKQPLAEGETPAILVDFPGDPDPEAMPNNIASGTLTVHLSAAVMGAVPSAVADPILASAHGKLMTDIRWSGLAVNTEFGGAQEQPEDADAMGAALVTVPYRITYRTKYNDVSQLP